MIKENNFIRVAVIQDSSVIMNKDACIIKVENLSTEAAKEGAKVVLFPEAFISGYPRGLYFGTKIGSRSDNGKKDFVRYWENSIVIPSKEISLLAEIAKKNSIYLIVGIIEKDTKFSGGTLYCSIVYFSPKGEYLGKHRKLKPTGTERLIWGEGDGSTLTVINSPYGKIGGLICWENYMPLARTAMYSKGIDIYVAPTADARDEWVASMKHIALEGRCFVLSSNQYVTKEMYPKDLACYDELESSPDILCRGGSVIIDPNGKILAGPLYDAAGILYANLDLAIIPKSRFDFDVIGHYSRPDIFQLVVNENANNSVIRKIKKKKIKLRIKKGRQ
ncbi:MAG: carbon-nitrogen hydrolase family protein [Candidatus Heimdallarchaeota archaeon]|nr:carbon-nitrogen hydrolase family protein [Candidatus Heimdallarchaeota archaeon]